MASVQGAPRFTLSRHVPLWIALTLLLALLSVTARADHSFKPLDDFFKEVWTTRDGLPHNLVHGAVQTPDGYLWFATWEGVARYNGREFRIFDRGTVPALRDNGVRALRLRHFVIGGRRI